MSDRAAGDLGLARDNENLREQQRALVHLLRAVASGEGLESVFHALVEAAVRLCDAEGGEVHLADGDLLKLAVGHGEAPELYEYERAHPHGRDRSTATGRVSLSRDVVHIPDVLHDPDYT